MPCFKPAQGSSGGTSGTAENFEYTMYSEATTMPIVAASVVDISNAILETLSRRFVLGKLSYLITVVKSHKS
jgi:hypothetical protein